MWQGGDVDTEVCDNERMIVTWPDVVAMASGICIPTTVSTCVPAAEVHGARLAGYTEAWTGHNKASCAKLKQQMFARVCFGFETL
jgi:hypothetical protein